MKGSAETKQNIILKTNNEADVCRICSECREL